MARSFSEPVNERKQMNEDANSSCALPHHTDNWATIQWRKVIQSVNRLQRRIAKAVKEKRWGKAKALIHLLSKSFFAKLLAVLRVTKNKGGKTPGVDNLVWQAPDQKLQAANSLVVRGYRPKPLRRVYILKKDGKKRPLSIPTMHDRAMQALFKIALDPLAETLADRNSYGFRNRRSCNDAIAQCFLALCRKNSAQWIFEADIKACFDNIRHDWILKYIPSNKTILRKWLKAGYIEKKRLFPTEKGTPQGGIISPLIMNMVLDGLEKLIDRQYPRRKGHKVNFIRYADDFVITAANKEVITGEIIPLVENFMLERGLQLSPEKSKITHINNGFDFLSQNVRKFNGKLVIRPSKQSVQSFKDKISKMIRQYRGIPAHALIRILNPVIRGWSNYHKGICAKRTFAKVGSFIWEQLKRWTKYQHANKNRWWIFHRYFRDLHFSDKCITKNGTAVHRLYRIGYVPIRYHAKIKGDANPCLQEYDKYFSDRAKRRQALAKECRQITTFIVNDNKSSNNSRVFPHRAGFKSA
ncbi:group II intron reverse transcriptase/maturase [Marinilabilia rubra]|uniref:Group II intron reverse transcriptase/maturase n=1 Tax=Marinilabilia rubra TaxID=2162893 RepID=A0A2U2B354_9BACT|nr:group II intron reverse transcriptase/maturase [Marinilabilia rubra]PWD97484.1 group II intron reverse transcriptase/maturase [Marinilabilia rubra]